MRKEEKAQSITYGVSERLCVCVRIPCIRISAQDMVGDLTICIGDHGIDGFILW